MWPFLKVNYFSFGVFLLSQGEIFASYCGKVKLNLLLYINAGGLLHHIEIINDSLIFMGNTEHDGDWWCLLEMNFAGFWLAKSVIGSFLKCFLTC